MRGPFENPTFRRLFAGRVITNVGDSLYFIGAMWLVYDLTGDPFYTGLAGFLTMVPRAFEFLAGPLVDRWSIRRTLVSTQFVQAVVVSTIPLAHAFEVLTVGHVLVVMPVLSALNRLVYPAQVAALPRILEDDELVAANSAFSIAYQGLDTVANGIGGVLIGLIGAVALFAIDAVTFGVAALVFATLSIPAAGELSDEKQASEATETTGPVADGGAAAIEEPVSYLARLREGVTTLRGAFLGAVGAPLIEDRPFGRTLLVGFALTGVLWTAGLLADWLPVTAALFALALVPIGVVNVQIAAIVQSAPPNELVGRVSSLLGSALSSLYPLGSLAGGVVAGTAGPRAAMAAFGVIVLCQAGYVLLVDDLRTLPAPTETTLDRPTDDV